MSHYAKVVNGRVVEVIRAEADFFTNGKFRDTSPGAWIQTSYNTHGNVHTGGGTALRGNYAGIGYVYDNTHDVFYPAQPYASWSLNTTTWLWEPPVAMPTDEKFYKWNETNRTWDAQ